MKLRNEMVRTILMKNGAPLSASEYRDLELKMKAEAARNLLETLEAEDIMMKSMLCFLFQYPKRVND